MSKSKFYFIATGKVIKTKKKYEFRKVIDKLINRHALKILKMLKYFKKDVWFATKILKWELDAPSLRVSHKQVYPLYDYHFHRKNGSVVRVGDY